MSTYCHYCVRKCTLIIVYLSRLSSKMDKIYIVCILPEEWLAYSYDQLEDIIYESINQCLRCYHTLGGIIFTIRGVKTLISNYKNQFWFRRIDDAQNEPNRDYFMLYLDWEIMLTRECNCTLQ
ncbi:conserved hypothetical protein [Cotesia vestalis bracovirus]|nr:conserved hypothetical protein [Cotesia vestalis bracovirus]